MFSWFPIYFPLKDPVHLAAGEVGPCLDVAKLHRGCKRSLPVSPVASISGDAWNHAHAFNRVFAALHLQHLTLLRFCTQAVEVHMWRCVGPQKVWYEWAVAAPSATHIHNVSGRSYHVGL